MSSIVGNLQGNRLFFTFKIHQSATSYFKVLLFGFVQIVSNLMFLTLHNSFHKIIASFCSFKYILFVRIRCGIVYQILSDTFSLQSLTTNFNSFVESNPGRYLLRRCPRKCVIKGKSSLIHVTGFGWRSKAHKLNLIILVHC